MPSDRVPVAFHYATEDKVVRIPTKVFNDWARDNDYNPRLLLRMAEEENLLLGRHRAHLAAGVLKSTSREWCYDFSTSTLRLAISKLDVSTSDAVHKNLEGSE